MTMLSIGIGGMADAKARILAADAGLEAADTETGAWLYFASYDDMHRVLAPSRLAIVRAMAGQGPLAIREVARRVGRDVQAVHRDVVTLAQAGVIDRSDQGVTFPYDQIRFAFELGVAA
jgi:predicted transcriptional regulator